MSKGKKDLPQEEELKPGEPQEEIEAAPEQKVEEEAAETKYLRLMADFQNYKRRVEKEKTDIYAYANEKIVLEMLDVIDNLERALSHQGEEESNILDGISKVYKQLQGVLEKNGLEEIDALGKDFDPNFHNAVMTESSKEYDPGKVSLVMQKGYVLNNKVIRHSMVKVAE